MKKSCVDLYKVNSNDWIIKSRNHGQNFKCQGHLNKPDHDSYGRKDAEELAQKIAGDLAQLGHTVWLDKKRMITSNSWEQQIASCLLQIECPNKAL